MAVSVYCPHCGGRNSTRARYCRDCGGALYLSDDDPGPLPPDLLPGTLDMLILKSLTRGVMHGYGIVEHIRTMSDEVLKVEEGSLYPALQKLLIKGWVKASWRESDSGRQVREYRITPAGRKQLEVERSSFRRTTRAITAILDNA